MVRPRLSSKTGIRQKWTQLEFDRKCEIFIAGIGLLFAAVLTCVTTFQLSQMKEQTQAMKDQLDQMKSGDVETKIIAESAKLQADNTKKLAELSSSQIEQLRAGVEESHKMAAASQESINLARESFRLDMRAWVGPKYYNLKVFQAGKPITVEVGFTNTGKTPARNFSAFVVIHPSEKHLSEGEMVKIFSQYGKLQQKSDVVFRSEEKSITVSTSDIANDQTVEMVKSKQLFIYVFGELAYDDVFNNRHSTKFCGYYPSAKDRSFNICRDHNGVN